MHPSEAEYLGRADGGAPGHAVRMAGRANGQGRVAEPVAIGAALKMQSTLVAAGPEFPVVQCRCDLRQADWEIWHRHAFPRMMALVGVTLGPPQTRQVAASATWDVELPRICLTPSRTKLKPWI